MARSYWDVSVKSGGAWGANANLARPNDTFPIRKTSTQVKLKLADGDNAFMTPSTKYSDDPLVFSWLMDDGTIKAQIEGYINNQNDLRITDHDANIYYGRFINIDTNQVVGVDPDEYDITSTFEQIPSLA